MLTYCIDAHVHLSSPADVDCARAAGIAAIRNCGSNTGPLIASSKEINSKCTVSDSIRALYKRGGYGARFGVAVDSELEIRSEIRKLKRQGADIIKIMASGIVSLNEPGTITDGGFTQRELFMIVEEAASLDLPVAAHANGEQAIMAAAAAGVRSIEHGFFITGRCVEIMAEKQIFWTPTVGALARAANSARVSDDTRAYASGVIKRHLESVQHAFSIGVPLAIGTDCVLPDPNYRTSYERELMYFEQAGLSRDQVMRIAIDGGAKLLGIPFASGKTNS